MHIYGFHACSSNTIFPAIENRGSLFRLLIPKRLVWKLPLFLISNSQAHNKRRVLQIKSKFKQNVFILCVSELKCYMILFLNIHFDSIINRHNVQQTLTLFTFLKVHSFPNATIPDFFLEAAF